jgi:YaiO family outer membrane protein
LTKSTYLYLNFGVAPDSFFPERRYGAEIFWNFMTHWEASGGLRRLEFEDKTVHIYTGSIGYYTGNYYYSARPWVSNQPGETSFSLSLLMRRYYATRNDYWTIRLSGGQGADSDVSVETLILSNHGSLTFEWQKMFRPLWIVSAKAGVETRDFDTGNTRDSWLVGAGLKRLF